MKRFLMLISDQILFLVLSLALATAWIGFYVWNFIKSFIEELMKKPVSN